MEIEVLVKKVLDSEIFKNWQEQKDNYLVSCFFMNEVWNVDFYSKKTKKVTSFSIQDEKITKNEQNEVFQKEKKDLEKLNLNKIKITMDQALELADQIKQEKIPHETINKKIIILQQDKVPLWSISNITSSFNILNVKINAINKEVISQDLSSVMSFRKD